MTRCAGTRPGLVTHEEAMAELPGLDSEQLVLALVQLLLQLCPPQGEHPLQFLERDAAEPARGITRGP
jgi:hypothetical protein